MGFASLRLRASMATRWKIRLFVLPCSDRRRRTGITVRCYQRLAHLVKPLGHGVSQQGAGVFFEFL